ncbi:hypothetical protein RHGRI_022143 [Rhododendron griersonianum]|uniref:Uncharacterized protein n=1 Tax=Rhododendron griersonianum TaxID=479676 RepID=A0AAV6JMR7_9ERIC|nr:hypothetical protein RHGRI_022143 [Rhododendron griersonianum]
METEGAALDILQEVEEFLSSNPFEILTLILEDCVKASNALSKVFEAANLTKYMLPLKKMPRHGGDWPLVEDMVATNQRLIVFTSNISKEETEGIAYTWNFMVEYGSDQYIRPPCIEGENLSAAADDTSKSLVLLNYYLLPSDTKDLMTAINTCYAMASNRWANFFAIRYNEEFGATQATYLVDFLNGKLLGGSDDVNSCKVPVCSVNPSVRGVRGRGEMAHGSPAISQAAQPVPFGAICCYPLVDGGLSASGLFSLSDLLFNNLIGSFEVGNRSACMEAGGKIRSKLGAELSGDEGVQIEEGTAGEAGKEAAQDGMRKSIFCLSPAGDTPSSARLFDAIVSGCFPVIVSDELELPFEGILDYRKIALFVSSSDAVQPGWLLTFVGSISPSQIREMRMNLAKYSRHFLHSHPAQPLGPEDLVWRMIYFSPLFKNCEKAFSEVAAERVLDEMVKLIDDPQTSLKSRGIRFPSRDNESLAPIFTPPHSVLASESSPNLAQQLDREIPAQSFSAEQTKEAFDVARNSIELLTSVLSSSPQQDALECHGSQCTVQRIFETAGDNEALLFEALDVNDEIQKVILRYEDLMKPSVVHREPEPAMIPVAVEPDDSPHFGKEDALIRKSATSRAAELVGHTDEMMDDLDEMIFGTKSGGTSESVQDTSKKA